MALQPNELARRENGRLELRSGPARVRWALDDLVTADGHRLHCTFTCSVVALGDPAEWKMLEEVFLARAVTVTTDDVVRHFTPAFRTAAAKIARAFPADAWTKGDPAALAALTDALKEEGKRIGFTSGLDVLAPFQAHFESPSFEAARIEEMERTLAERRVAGQVEQFERAGKLLRQFEELRKAAPDLTAADVLRQVSPADQGLMFQTLLLASGKEGGSKEIWGVAGQAVIRIDPKATPPALADQFPMPDGVGPLRSVQAARLDGRDVLLVGARDGVVVFDPESGARTEYRDPGIDSQLGFSSAVVWNDRVIGCHGEAGVVAWRVGSGDAPDWTVRPVELRGKDNPPPLPAAANGAGRTIAATAAGFTTAGGYVTAGAVQSIAMKAAGIRNLVVLDERRIALSVGRYLTVIDRDNRRSEVQLNSHAEVLAIVPTDPARIAVVQEDGTVSVRDRATLAAIADTRRAGRLKAAGVLPWLGSKRLLLATEEGPIVCVGLDDDLVTQYLSPHRGLRVVSAAQDVVCAISPDRQRVILWNSWDGKRPAAEVLVAGVTRHRVGDIEVG